MTVQLSAPRWVVGRALALYQMATFGGMACGSWIWGVLAERYGVSERSADRRRRPLAGAAFGLRYALPELTSLNLDPLSRWKEPEVALDIRPRSGPIVVTIEYLIREQDVADFLAVMAERRRSGAATARVIGPCCATLKTPNCGSSAITPPPGWSMSATISAEPKPTPPSGKDCWPCIRAPKNHASIA